MEKRSKNRIEEIDVLRGFAALTVMLGHYGISYRYFHHLPPLWFAPNGTYSVYLFFVISGFVIAMTLHRCHTGLDFFASRFSRIFPAYWAAILITSAALYLLHSPDARTLPEIAMNFTMLERFFGLHHVDRVYWTLNVELSFYIWMFVVFKAGWLDRIQKIIPCVLAFQFVMGMYAHHVGHPFSQGTNVVLLLEYAHLFCAGMLFYEAREKGWTPWSLILLFWCGINQGAILFRTLELEHRDVNDIVTIFVIFLIMSLVIRGYIRWIVSPVMVFLGTISYTLYLLHAEIGMAAMDTLQRHGISYSLAMPAACAITFILATLVTFLVERPAMKAIRRLYKKDHPKAGIKVEPQPPAGSAQT